MYFSIMNFNKILLLLLLLLLLILPQSRGSAVGKATDYGLDEGRARVPVHVG
jgi:hypothetical protein